MKRTMKVWTFTFLVVLTISSANKPVDKIEFLVTNNSVGVFRKGMTVKDILTIIPKNQVKKIVEYDDYENSYDDYKYFDNENKHLLTITPTTQDDLNSTINRVLVIDPRYKTDKNIGLSSTYRDLRANYKIAKFEPVLEHIILTVEGLNASFSIRKDKLLENWWDDSNKKIDTTKIPDTATFDTFVIWWE